MAATPALNVNQFAQIPVVGMLDLETAPATVLTGAVSVDQVTALVAGQGVKVENTAGGVPKVLALASSSETPNFLVVRNLKDQNFPASARLELAGDGAIIWMNANAAIARWAAVELDNATPGNVGPAAGVNPVVGIAFDSASVTGQLIRVLVQLPRVASASNGALRTVNVTATLAQINAGLVIVPGVAGKKITVSSFVERVVGAFAATTSVNLQSDTTAVIVEATAVAGLTNGAVLTSAPTANVALGAGFAAPLPTAEGLKVVNIGAAATTGTSIQYLVSYTQA